MAQNSNIDDVVKFLADFVESFDFTRKGKDQSLGRDVANLVVERIMERSSRNIAPDGTPSAPNSNTPSFWHPEGYRTWKTRSSTYGWDMDKPNRRTNQMLSQTSLGAKIKMQAHEIKIGYGTGDPSKSGYSPTKFITESDEEVTDIQKAVRAHTGTDTAPARPFYGFGQGDHEEVCKLSQEVLNDYILESPYGR